MWSGFVLLFPIDVKDKENAYTGKIKSNNKMEKNQYNYFMAVC